MRRERRKFCKKMLRLKVNIMHPQTFSIQFQTQPKREMILMNPVSITGRKTLKHSA